MRTGAEKRPDILPPSISIELQDFSNVVRSAIAKSSTQRTSLPAFAPVPDKVLVLPTKLLNCCVVLSWNFKTTLFKFKLLVTVTVYCPLEYAFVITGKQFWLLFPI